MICTRCTLETVMKKITIIAFSLLLLSACAADDDNSGIATGMLKTREYIVTMYAGTNGPLYSVRGLDGTLLDQDISMDTMVARYPELNYLQDNDSIDWAGLDSEVFNFEPGSGRR